jgi:ATP-dependent Clp protease ATP-binding subunit ClpX
MDISSFPIPSKILENLDPFIIGQEKAKRKIAGAVYEHYLSHSAKESGKIEFAPRSNLLLYGPTGSGKTLIAQTLAKSLDLPFVQVDLTHFASTGYVGEDLGSIIQKLLNASPCRKKAEKAILFLDEFDKIAGRASSEKDVSGFALQAELLKMMEGDVYNWTDRTGSKFHLDLSGVFFIFAGAFPGLPQIIKKRLGVGSIGFPEAKKRKQRGFLEQGMISKALPEDFHSFGFLPEIIGRMGHIAALEPLEIGDLGRILLEAKGSPLLRTQEFFKLHGINLQFSMKAVQALSRKAFSLSTGARALSSVLGDSLEDLRFQCPELQEEGVLGIRIKDIGEDGCPKIEMEKGIPLGLQQRISLQEQILHPLASKKTKKVSKQSAKAFSSMEGTLWEDDGDNEAEAKEERTLGDKKTKNKKRAGLKKPRKKRVLTEDEKRKEREQVKLLLFEKIKEDERRPGQKIPLVSTGTLISWFMNLYDKKGKEAFDITLDLVRTREETLSMFHLMLAQSDGKELGTILKYWDYWDALQQEKGLGFNDDLPF